MNFLAHVYFSYSQPGLLIGNMIGDFVKGNQYLQYSESIQKGILLHRQIDTFTDAHPTVLETKQIFRDAVGRYDGAFLDVSYDYYLANDPNILCESEWRLMTQQAYATVDMHITSLPQAFKQMFSYMENGDWLFNYRYAWQIKKSFTGLARRAKYLDEKVNPFASFEKNFGLIEKSFESFFPELETFVLDWIRKNHITLQ
ncbi:MAG: DUF479 domain-containing protein [Pseudopedobacter saltans]|uniref:DUF479 domain-containing protein n=1 Tax=Pseudopedobacter saltans TaxID=151895 RepID=A0A2W5GTQ6_9SPHI|nr:MAG: DUF479 domain-containing protein [Pseudopedobacter saltans]